MLRATRPLAVRQSQVDERLLAGVDAVAFATSVAQRATSAFPEPLPPDTTSDVSTEIGDLFMHAADRVMTPFIREHGFWEAAEAAFLRRILKPGHTFLDIGANVGYFSVLASPLVGQSGRVVAVEPEQRNLALLKANLWRNGCGNAVVLPIAAHRHTGFLPLRLDEENRGDHQVGWREGASVLVPCARLDDLLGDLPVDVIKIDTQGVDHDVIAGLSGLLTRATRPTILCEFWLEGMERRGVDPWQVAVGYQELGFALALLRDELGEHPASAAEVVEAAAAEAGRYVNVVLR